jgi:hypothetical protein
MLREHTRIYHTTFNIFSLEVPPHLAVRFSRSLDLKHSLASIILSSLASIEDDIKEKL